MTSVNALTATSTTATNGSTSSGTSTTSNDQMGKDTFLKLLVAQLQYQDPSNPADATQFISQTAQFTVVEKLSDLASLNEQLLTATQSQSAASLVGRTVTWKDGNDTVRTGLVTSATLGASPTVTIGDQVVDLSAVTGVTATSSTTGAKGSTTSGTAG